MSVKSKTIYITMAITICAFAYYMIEQWYQYNRNAELLHKDQKSIIENYYENFPMRILIMMNNSAKFLLKDKEIAYAFAERDRDKLEDLTGRYYSYMNMMFSKSGLIINYIDPDGNVIYRAQSPDQFGDSILSRPMITQAVSERKPLKGVEMGRNGLFLRHIEPVAYNGTFIGFIETGVHLSFFTKRINNIAGIKTILLIDKKQASYYKGSFPSVGDVFQYCNNTGLNLDEFMSNFRSDKAINYMTIHGTDFEIIKEFELKDFKGEKIGEYIFFAERSGLHSWFYKHFMYMAIIGIIGIIIVSYIIRNGFVKSIEELEKEHKQVLNELVLTNASLEERVNEEVEANRDKDIIINQQKKVEDMGQMLSALSHHWRQPINAVGLYIQDIMDAYRSGELDEEYLEEFENVSIGLLRNLSDSIDTYKSFYKPSSANEIIQVTSLLKEIATMLDASMDAHGISMYLAVDCSDIKFGYKKLEKIENCGCETLRVKGPVNEFKQSILNIIFNSIGAIKEEYSGESSGEIKLYVVEHDEELTLDIIDNGVGISEKDIDKVFNPFFTTKDEGQGVGLGLYVAKTVIERHMGGKLTVTSYKNETSFRITLKKV